MGWDGGVRMYWSGLGWVNWKEGLRDVTGVSSWVGVVRKWEIKEGTRNNLTCLPLL